MLVRGGGKMRYHKQVVELIPYKSFKERLRIVQALVGKASIEIFKDYIYVERSELDV